MGSTPNIKELQRSGKGGGAWPRKQISWLWVNKVTMVLPIQAILAKNQLRGVGREFCCWGHHREQYSRAQCSRPFHHALLLSAALNKAGRENERESMGCDGWGFNHSRTFWAPQVFLSGENKTVSGPETGPTPSVRYIKMDDKQSSHLSPPTVAELSAISLCITASLLQL